MRISESNLHILLCVYAHYNKRKNRGILTLPAPLFCGQILRMSDCMYVCTLSTSVIAGNVLVIAFSVHGPMVWNSLPDDLRAQQDYESFRQGLKTWLFCRY